MLISHFDYVDDPDLLVLLYLLLLFCCQVNKAKYLLRLIKEEHLQAFYNHRTARVVLVLQREMIDHMVSEGSLSHKLAEAFLGEIEDDDKEITIEREKTHR